MAATDLFVDGQLLRLGSRIGKGGEGEVFALNGDLNRAAKIYTVPDLASREAKVAAMIDAALVKRTSLVAFPLSAIRKKNGSFIGFLMPRVSGHRAIHDLYAPGSRKHKFPRADYRFLARAASNTARAVAAVHSVGCVIGDINHSGILISDKAVAALIDSDSFQFIHQGSTHRCKVGVPEYTPPELQGQSLANIVRTSNHDAFGLAVAIFQLLFMGRHPFVGGDKRGDVPPLHEAIRDFRFAYSQVRDVGLDRPPGILALSEFSPNVAQLFEKSFSPSSRDSRPTASEWVRVLESLENALTKCSINPLHHYPGDAARCPWCELENKLGTILFLPFVSTENLVLHPFDPGATGFNLDQVLAQIRAVPCVSTEQVFPVLNSVDAKPSERAVSARSNDWLIPALRVGAFFGAVGLAIASPVAWILYVPLFWFAFFGSTERSKVSKDPFVKRYVEIERQWLAAYSDWLRRCGVVELEKLQVELKSAATQYGALADEERTKINEYNASRKARQLLAFLDDFEIRDSKIKGIGPAKLATLASYGVETAADVSLEKLLSVPGFGPNNSRGLIDWRAQRVSRFVFRSAHNDADIQELAKIKLAINAKASTLRRTLSAGAQNLSLLSGRVKSALAIPDPILNTIHIQRESARVDLEFLEVEPPHVPAPVTAPANVAAPVMAPQSQSATPTCPRCGQSMIRRTARRGPNSGSAFWGCTRFPMCTGTRK